MATEQGASTPGARHQLGDLVLKRKGELRLSYEKLADRCVDPTSGEKAVKSSWLHRIATRLPVQAPDVGQLRGMAAGLEVPLHTVQDAAAAQFFGMDSVYSRDRKVRATVPGFEDLSPEDQRKVMELVERFQRG
ncbi:XRE family transcriptional regulator [Streptomyces sp. HNM0645]|uniref:XRE family transcriptional regulator n=1 Tax=Streptomyces sp. HNM0645 TaxID=2782343 RepID=UPI0024B815C8|nr:XRE family transcriptional regulator [Streptomyces sp. HNM0645]MDI9885359.1 XRE family transcriptional regulator [Streptomyces sp. HNM0645]